MIHTLLLRDLDTAFPDNDPELAFVVERLGDAGVRVDLSAMGDDGRRSLGEDD